MSQTPGGSYPHPLRYYRRLATRKGRLEAGAFAVEGERAVGQVVGSHPQAVLEIVSVEGMPSPFPRYPHRTLTEGQFRHISTSRTPQGILAVVRLPMETYSASLPPECGPKVLLLEDVQDPGNVGTLVRTAAAFGFTGIILTDKCADPFSPKCVQSTAGSVLSLWQRRTTEYLSMVGDLRHRGYFLLAADLDGDEDTTVCARDRLVLALGNEAAGLSADLIGIADYRLRLPTVADKVESLNVAACGAILMYLSTVP